MIFSPTTHPAKFDFENYVHQAKEQGIKNIHIDHMDGKYVADKTPKICLYKKLFKENPDIDFLVHIMSNNPARDIKRFAKIGAKNIVFQIEGAKNSQKIFDKFAGKINLGIAIDLPTKIEKSFADFIEQSFCVLIMLTKAGKSFQEINKGAFKKIGQVKKLNKSCKICLDGGVNKENFDEVLKYKPDIISSGGFAYNLIKEGKMREFLKTIKNL